MGETAPFERALMIETKLSPPRLRDDLIDRGGEVRRLDDVTVVAVIAPAGYGKTTLLAQYARSETRPVVWVSLDESDDDLDLLVLEVAASLDRVQPLDVATKTRLAAPRASSHAAVAQLVSLLAANPGAVVILDDVHRVTSPVCREALALLAERVPPGVRLVMAGRDDVLAPLARLRASGLAAEITREDLELSWTDALAILADAHPRLAREQLERLAVRIEGWPAGLQLAAMSMRGIDDPERFVAEFAGDHRDIASYLADEVLARLDDELLAFLTRTSVLDRFSAPLCDAVLKRSDSADVIDGLVATNLFIVALDERREWYRYHQLFADVLRAELARRHPTAARTVHGRAAAWFEQHGRAREAIEHAFAGDDRDRAARLVAAVGQVVFNQGMQETTVRWLAEFSEAEEFAHPPLALLNTWVGGLTGDAAHARRSLAVLDGLTYDGPLPTGESSLASAVALMRTVYGWDGITAMVETGELACSLETPGSVAHARAALFLGAALVLAGRAVDAAPHLESAAAVRDSAHNTAVMAHAMLGTVALDRRDSTAADRHFSVALQLLQRHGLEEYVSSTVVWFGLALRDLARNDRASARTRLDRGLAVLPRTVAWPWWHLYGQVLAARVALALGDLPLTSTLIADAKRGVDDYPDPGVLPDMLDRVASATSSARAILATMIQPLTPSEQRVLELLPSHLTVEAIAEQLHLSKNTVKGYIKSIYRKLEVTSRDQAVARFREIEQSRLA